MSQRNDRREFLKLGAAAGVGGATVSLAAGLPPLPSNARTAAAMPMRNLGRTGFQVGLFSLGGQAAIEQPDNAHVAVPLVERALDLGVNYIDTAARYGGDARWSQRYIGEVMKRRRGEAFLASKTHDRTRDGSLKLLEESLKLLDTDHLDLWQVHNLSVPEQVDQIFAKGGGRPPPELPSEAAAAGGRARDGDHRHEDPRPRPDPEVLRAACAGRPAAGRHRAGHDRDVGGAALRALAAGQHRHRRLRHDRPARGERGAGPRLQPAEPGADGGAGTAHGGDPPAGAVLPALELRAGADAFGPNRNGPVTRAISVTRAAASTSTARHPLWGEAISPISVSPSPSRVISRSRFRSLGPGDRAEG